MGEVLKEYLRLLRPTNIVTAISDILAGIAIAAYFAQSDINNLAITKVLLLILATIGLYGGGVVLNDVFDSELDKKERPERPIPRGTITRKSAAWLGIIFLIAGITAAAFVHKSIFSISSIIAFSIAVAAVYYDKWGKHHVFIGPLNMGICRGLNLVLGMSILPLSINNFWYIGLIPILYIAAITIISRGEVHGGNKKILYVAALFYTIVITSILFISYINNTVIYSIVFLILFSVMIFIPLKKAIHNPVAPLIGKSVKAGVLALIIMNAAWAAAFGSIYLALSILLLLPISLWLAKVFAVT